jgi:hypothetical protein
MRVRDITLTKILYTLLSVLTCFPDAVAATMQTITKKVYKMMFETNTGFNNLEINLCDVVFDILD